MKRSPLKRTAKPMRRSRPIWPEYDECQDCGYRFEESMKCPHCLGTNIKRKSLVCNTKPIHRSRMKPVGKKRSKVTNDGREILRGKDYQKRRLQVWELASRRCQGTVTKYGENLPGWCGRLLRLEDAHIHHVKKRTALGGRDDSIHNLTLLCPECHSRIHETERRPK